jgi:hypothetical protein
MNSDKDQSTEFNINPVKNSIDHSKNLSSIDEENNEGGLTSTPARPVDVETLSQNPESAEVVEEKEKPCWSNRRFIVLLTIGLIIIVTAAIWAIVYAAKGPRKTYSVRKSFRIPTQGFRAVKIAGESIVMTD